MLGCISASLSRRTKRRLAWFSRGPTSKPTGVNECRARKRDYPGNQFWATAAPSARRSARVRQPTVQVAARRRSHSTRRGAAFLRDAVINSKWVRTPLLDVVDVLECNGLGSAKYRALLRVEFAEEVQGSIYLTDLRPSFQTIFQRPTQYLLRKLTSLQIKSTAVVLLESVKIS